MKNEGYSPKYSLSEMDEQVQKLTGKQIIYWYTIESTSPSRFFSFSFRAPTVTGMEFQKCFFFSNRAYIKRESIVFFNFTSVICFFYFFYFIYSIVLILLFCFFYFTSVIHLFVHLHRKQRYSVVNSKGLAGFVRVKSDWRVGSPPPKSFNSRCFRLNILLKIQQMSLLFCI